MERALTPHLETWLAAPRRRALVLRGARQVGKTWLVRDLADRVGLDLCEVNFERDPQLATAFGTNDPRRILTELGLLLDRPIEPARSILFLDEIQAAPAVLAALRWFTEELPELPVIAAGSLLEFALGERARSMPVGRITYCHVEPLGFAEYLAAHDQDRLLDELAGFHPTDLPGGGIPSVVHESASRWYARYAMVGGMPAVVRADVDSGNPAPCRRLQQDLMATFRDDFSRYGTRLDPPILDSTLLAVAAQLGSKFVYSKIGDGVKQHQGRQALELLARARLLTIATHSLANGIPLGGEVRARNQKVLLLDVGLAHALLRTPASPLHPHRLDLAPQVRGQLTEQLAGQQLRALQPGSGEDTLLHYWQNVGGRSGEIDFLTQIAQRVVPIELKSGASGAMKSLHQFIHAKGLDFAVRIDSNPPSLQQVDVKTTGGDRARYRLLNLPGYLVWRVGELATRLLA